MVIVSRLSRIILGAPFTRRAWDEFRYAAACLPLAIAGFAAMLATTAFGIG